MAAKVSELKILRTRAGLTIHDLADKAGVSAAYHGFEQGRASASPRVIYNLATALAHSIEDDEEKREALRQRIAFDLLTEAAEIDAEATGYYMANWEDMDLWEAGELE